VEAPPKCEHKSSHTTAAHGLTALAESMSDLTKAFAASSAPISTPNLPTTPQRKVQAATQAQEIEDQLSDEELTALLHVLQQEPHAADFYLNIKHDSLRSSWVKSKIAPFMAPQFLGN